MEAVQGVDRACCLFEEKRNRLHAYYTGTVDVAALGQAMGKRLPAYMIPNLMDRLERMPLNKNGKIDRKALAQQKEG